MEESREVIDHLGRIVTIPANPQRIISLCPSITETLFALGLSEKIVGRTRYCIHPAEQVEHVTAVGGTKQINFDKIAELAPDLIIVEKEENPKEIVEQLVLQYPVYVMNVESVEEALRMICDLGEISNRKEEARLLLEQIQTEFQKIKQSVPKRVAYMIWRKPYMAVGSPTYIDSIIATAGWSNPFRGRQERYPEVTLEELRDAKLDLLYLSSEPFPFTEAHIEEFQTALPDTQIVLVDGEIFSWYGARMIKVPEYLSELNRKYIYI